MVVALHMCVVCMSTCDEEHVECAREYNRVRGDVLAQRLVEHATELAGVQRLLRRVHAKRDSPRVIEQLVHSTRGDGAPLDSADIYVQGLCVHADTRVHRHVQQPGRIARRL